MARKRPILLDTNYCPRLGCAYCGYEYLHQQDVEIFRRRREDSVDGLHLWVKGEDFVAGGGMVGNPSDRRDGIRITFDCEGCDKVTVLTIAQHKGFELFETIWEEPKAPGESNGGTHHDRDSVSTV